MRNSEEQQDDKGKEGNGIKSGKWHEKNYALGQFLLKFYIICKKQHAPSSILILQNSYTLDAKIMYSNEAPTS
jgi:hypothetical protein